jgi:methionyl-tRNA synthetase
MKALLALSQFGNKYFDDSAPWALIKTNKDACGHKLYQCMKLVKALNILMAPFVPFSSDKLWKMIGHQGSVFEAKWEDALEPVPAGQVLENPALLYKKLDLTKLEEDDKIEETPSEEKKEEKSVKKEEPEMGLVKFDDFQKLDLQVGRIVEVSDHPNADKLFVLKVDFGDDQVQIVAGLRQYYQKEEMEGKNIIVIRNLEPVKLRGVESNGMLLAAEDDEDHVILLTTEKDIKPGSKVH